MKIRNLTKKTICFIVSVIISAQFFIFGACKKENEKNEDTETRFEFIDVGGKYAVRISGNGFGWSNAEKGVFGARVSYDDVSDVSGETFAYYDEYSRTDGGYFAKAVVVTEDGSEFSAEDYYSVGKNSVEVVRTFTVVKEGSAKGFATYFPIRDESEGSAEERQWFAPGAYYGNKEYNFSGVGIKIGFSEEAIAPADVLSAPVVANYNGKVAFSIADRTAGRRETVVSDYSARYSSVIVDERFNIPGIGLRNVYEGKAKVEMFYAYPAHTYNFINTRPFTYNYRMLPITVGLKRQCAFSISTEKYDNFTDAVDGIWRRAYSDRSVIERRYSPLSVYKAIANNLYENFGYMNGVPQYMTNSDHPLPESGFLYRNVDLAYLMIAAGYRLNKPEYISQADELIEYHVAKDLIVDNSVNKVERAEAEGLIALLNAYKTHLENGVDKSDWLAFVLKKTAEKGKLDHPMDVPLYLAVAEFTKDPYYINKTVGILEEFDAQHDEFYYTGAIVNTVMDAIPNRESGMIYLNIYLDVYRLTGDEKYLEKARRCELYLESNMIVQNIKTEAEDATGYEVFSDGKFREAGVGNENVKSYGLSWISGQTNSADNMAAYSVPDLLYLYSVTGEERYKEFADYLVTNSTLYVNMGDKNWLMDDFRYSTGYGFQNEYFGISSTTDVSAAGRGSMHASNLAWNMFVVLYSLEKYACYDSGFLVDEVTRYDTSVLVKTIASSEKNGIFRSYNAVDKDPSTAWVPSADDTERSLIIDLGEYVDVSEVKIVADGVKTALLYVSADGAEYKEAGEISSAKKVEGVYRYVKITLKDADVSARVYDVDIMGNPVVLKNYALGAKATVYGASVSEMTDWNYSTVWRSSGRDAVVTVDLGQIRTIAEVAMTFGSNLNFIGQDYVSLPVSDAAHAYKIEYSNTGDSWKVYADRSSDPRSLAVYKETGSVKARYFKITARVTSGNLTVTEIKIYGV